MFLESFLPVLITNGTKGAKFCFVKDLPFDW